MARGGDRRTALPPERRAGAGLVHEAWLWRGIVGDDGQPKTLRPFLPPAFMGENGVCARGVDVPATGVGGGAREVSGLVRARDLGGRVLGSWFFVLGA